MHEVSYPLDKQVCANTLVKDMFVVSDHLDVDLTEKLFDDNLWIIFFSSPKKHMFWVLIRIALNTKVILISIHHVCFMSK